MKITFLSPLPSADDAPLRRCPAARAQRGVWRIIRQGEPGCTTARHRAQETIDATYAAEGTPTAHTYSGVRLINVLDAVGMPGAPQTHNPLLRRYLIVTASDGYQIVLSGGELDPNFGNRPAYLAWAEDGAPLSAEDGPVHLVVPGDLRGGRFVRGVVRIEVLDITEPDV